MFKLNVVYRRASHFWLYSREALCLPEHYQQEQVELLERPLPLPPTCLVTEHELKLFKDNPFKLVGMSFIQEDEASGEEVFFKVAEIGMSKKDVWYQVHSEGCSSSDCVRVDQKEMLQMVECSRMFVA